MAFFYNEQRSEVKARSRGRHDEVLSPERIKELGCKVCPLNKEEGRLCTPKMQPSGSEKPLVYVLGEAPGETEDEKGEPFVGKSGQLLRKHLTSSLVRHTRFNNVIRCHPEGNRDPEALEVQACRGYVEDDIARTKPKVILGTGNFPLEWVVGRKGISHWRSRIFPVKVQDHVCWYYAVNHPSFVLHNRWKDRKGNERESEHDAMFKMDMRRLVDMVLDDTVPTAKVYDKDFDKGIVIIDGTSQTRDFNLLEDCLNEIAGFDTAGIDLETKNLRPFNNDSKILTCSVGSFNRSVAFPVEHPKGWNSTYQRKVVGLLGEYILKSRRKVAHHVGFELEWLSWYYGFDNMMKTEWGDTMAQAWGLVPHFNGKMLKLETLTILRFGFNLKAISDIDFEKILDYDLRFLLTYNGMDTKWTDLLFHVQEPLVQSDSSARNEYERQMRLVPATVASQIKGLYISQQVSDQLNSDFISKISRLERQIHRTPEVEKYKSRFGEFNAGSSDHVIRLMGEICKRDEIKKKGDKGEDKFSGDESALSAIPAREVPSAPLILEYRSVVKMKSTYIDPLNLKMRGKTDNGGKLIYDDGLVHTNYNTMLTGTGRLSSDDPNSQNFPKHKYKEIRSQISAPPGYKFVACDYGAIEARVIAMASKDKRLVEAFWTGYDIHKDWGQRLYKLYPRILDRLEQEFKPKDEESLFKVLRQEAKNNWVFPQFFGATYYSCAENLKVPEDICQELQVDFFKEFSGVKKWHEKVTEFYNQNGYVQVLSGRRRYGPLSANMIINTPVQGSAADIVNEGYSDLVVDSIVLEKPQYTPILNVHDDLSFYLPIDTLEEDIHHIARRMCGVKKRWINVPLLVEVEMGDDWYSLKEYKKFKSNEMFKT